MAGSVVSGRHRLGRPGLVHCMTHRQVAEALGGHRAWWQRSRHSLAGLRRRAVAVAMERAWVPSAATAMGNAA
jgi:hypothetical protein